MIALILKDLNYSKKTLGLYMLIVAGMMLAFLAGDMGYGAISGFVFVMVYGTVIRIEHYEEKNRGYKLLKTLPIKQSKIVYSKYITAMILTLVASGYTLIIQSVVMNLPGFDTGLAFEERLIATLVPTFLSLLFSGVFYRMVFKYGALKAINKSRFILIGIFLIPFLGSLALVKLGVPLGQMLEGMTMNHVYGGLVGLLGIYFLLMLDSVRIFKRSSNI